MSETFKLPDGNLVSTGNILNPGGPVGLFSEFPSRLEYLSDSEIEYLLDPSRPAYYMNRRKQSRKRMINQSTIGKCNASAAIAAVYDLREKNGMPFIALADNHMYWNINDGQERGSLLHRGMAQGKIGVAPRVLFDGDRKLGHIPHDAWLPSHVSREMLRAADHHAARFQMHEPLRVPKDWEGFKRTVATALAMRYPIIMAWDVTQNSMRVNGKGYIVSGRGKGNHASEIHAAKYVGGNDLVHVDLKNSWGPSLNALLFGPTGTSWGEGGFGLMTMEQLFHCIQWHDFYVLTGFSEDPTVSPLVLAA